MGGGDGKADPERLGPHLRVVRRVAEGGMGIVYEAQDERDPSGPRRAVKVLKGKPTGSLEERFVRECQVASRLGGHPGIVPVLEAGRLPTGELFCVMEFVDGQTLDRRFYAGVPPQEAARLIAAVARAVAFAHEKGVIHRDLKPENVIVTRDGAPRLTDFGIAKALAEDPLTATGMVMGTPVFMAPEQAADSKRVDPRTDVYGLGGILYYGLTRRPPLDLSGLRMSRVLDAIIAAKIKPAHEVVPGLDPALSAICMRALSRQPAARWATAADLAAALEAWCSGDRTIPDLPVVEDKAADAGAAGEESLALPIAIAIALAVIVAGAVVLVVGLG